MKEVSIEEQAEIIFELREENKHLRGQITYLQEELASAEDEVNSLKDQLSKANNIEI